MTRFRATIMQTLDGHQTEVTAIALSADGDTFASGDLTDR